MTMPAAILQFNSLSFWAIVLSGALLSFVATGLDNGPLLAAGQLTIALPFLGLGYQISRATGFIAAVFFLPIFALGVYNAALALADREGGLPFWITIAAVSLPYIWYFGACRWILPRVGPRRSLFQGAFHLLKGQVDDGLSALDDYTVAYPDDPVAHLLRAGALLGRHELETALEAVQQSIIREPTPAALGLRSLILAMAGDVPRSMDAAKMCLREEPGNQFARTALSCDLISVRRLNTAILELRNLQKECPSPGTALMLYDAYRLQGDRAAAMVAIRDAESLARKAVKSSRIYDSELAFCLAVLGNFELAQEFIQSALDECPRSALAVSAQIAVANQRSDTDGLERLLARLTEITPHGTVGTLTDPDFTHLLAERRFRHLLATALRERAALIERLSAVLAAHKGRGND